MDEMRFEISDWGMFDSRVKYPVADGTILGDRAVTEFELELITEPREGCSYIDGTAHRRERGMLLLAKPGQQRRSGLHFRCGYVHFSAEGALRESLLALPDVAYPADPARCFASLRQMLRFGPADADPLRLQEAFFRFLADCADAMRETERRSAYPGVARNRALLADAARWMEQHCAERMPLASAAERVHLSPTYFHKLFTACYGQTPNEYLLQCRLERAKLLLIETDESLSQIAEDCGFSSQSYFGKQFRREVGVSPLKYRSEMLGRMTI